MHPLLAEAATWSVLVRDASTSEVVLEHASESVRSAASVPKLLLLVACAALIDRGELDAGEALDRGSVAPVGDSGIWQHLGQQTLTVDDAATLVGSASDNLATNVLLERVGLDAVTREAARLSIDDVVLHDAVRDERGPQHPPRLGSASAVALVSLLSRLEAHTLSSPAVSRRVLGWLQHSLDLSMVAPAFGLDPLSHGGDSGSISLVNKTGTDAGVRADAGIVRGRARTLFYAVIANWSAGTSADGEARAVREVLASMRSIGERLREAVENDHA